MRGVRAAPELREPGVPCEPVAPVEMVTDRDALAIESSSAGAVVGAGPDASPTVLRVDRSGMPSIRDPHGARNFVRPHCVCHAEDTRSGRERPADAMRVRCGLDVTSVRTTCDATATGEGTDCGLCAQEVRMPRAADAHPMRCESGQLTPHFFQRRRSRARYNRWGRDHLPPPHLVVVSPRGLEPRTR